MLDALQPFLEDKKQTLALDGGEDGLDFYRVLVRGRPDPADPGVLFHGQPEHRRAGKAEI